MTVQILEEVLEVVPASVRMEKSHLLGGEGSDLNGFVLFIQILVGACEPG